MKKIAVLPGDGIGPEIVAEAVALIEVVGTQFQHSFQLQYGLIGGAAIDEAGTPLPDETIVLCKESDAVLLGAVGGPKWDQLAGEKRPEAGLLGIRKALGLYANLRPVKVYPALIEASPLKPDRLQGVDLLIVRELTGGLYFGKPQERRQEATGLTVVDTLLYTEEEIERILRKGFELARLRRGKLTSVDKANVLESSRVWRELANQLAKEYPEVELNHLLVDNAAMQLIRDPAQFDVIVTENMFGDILSDEAAMLTGSLGMLPSASLSTVGPGLFEPVHGSAPDIAGKKLANPLATFLSVAMMFRYAFALPEAAAAVEAAVDEVLQAGYRTADMARPGESSLSTTEMGHQVRAALRRNGR